MICRKVVRQVYYLLQVLLGVGSAGTPSPTPGMAYIPICIHLCVKPFACLPFASTSNFRLIICGSVRSELEVHSSCSLQRIWACIGNSRFLKPSKHQQLCHALCTRSTTEIRMLSHVFEAPEVMQYPCSLCFRADATEPPSFPGTTATKHTPDRHRSPVVAFSSWFSCSLMTKVPLNLLCRQQQCISSTGPAPGCGCKGMGRHCEAL